MDVDWIGIVVVTVVGWPETVVEYWTVITGKLVEVTVLLLTTTGIVVLTTVAVPLAVVV